MTPSPWTVAALATLALAAVPALLAAVNLALYRRPAAAARNPGADAPLVSVLIPARDEAAVIGRAVRSVLASDWPRLELVVMDDNSRDATRAEALRAGGGDPRLRIATAPGLPAGWCGKQHACAALAGEAAGDVLVFVDADVELAPDAVGRMVAFLGSSGADLVSGVPRQRTGSLLERLLIPLIHFVLLGFLPIAAMRRSPSPSFAAGCGQLLAVRRPAYRRAGGHAAIRASRHDGITLPRAFRRARCATDLFDATAVASCRMYEGPREVWAGLAKNAAEGMAAPAAIVPWTTLLGGGQVAPPLLLVASLLAGAPAAAVALAAAGSALGFATRAALALRFRQSWLGVLLHPLGVALLLAIQWYALGRRLTGRPLAWKGRTA